MGRGPRTTGSGSTGTRSCSTRTAAAWPTPAAYRRIEAGDRSDGVPAMKSVVVDLGRYDWEGDHPLGRSFRDTVVYEAHLAGFTADPGSGVAPDRRGTYAGFIDKIPYLVDLGITAVELLPVFQFDRLAAPAGLVNYWGYQPVSYFSPHAAYAAGSARPPPSTSSATWSRRSTAPGSRSSSMSSTTTPPRSAPTARPSRSAASPTTTTTCSTTTAATSTTAAAATPSMRTARSSAGSSSTACATGSRRCTSTASGSTSRRCCHATRTASR